MTPTSSKAATEFSTRFLSTLLYLVVVALLSAELLALRPSMLLLAYPLAMLCALLSRHDRIKQVAAVASIGILIYSHSADALYAGNVAPIFLLAPFAYIVLFPGLLWPIAAGILSVAGFIHYQHLDTTAFNVLTKESIQLITIAFFAAVGVYYKRKLQRQLERYKQDSQTDFLTQLKNRRVFTHDTRALEQEDDAGVHYALLQLDIDDFKLINDSLGHQQGDRLLTELARCLRDLDFARVNLYRTGGDEFAIILRHTTDIRFYADQVAQTIQQACDRGFCLDNRHYHMTMSIGIALFDDAMHDSDIWCRNVDIAIMRAKQKGKNVIQHFDQALISETIHHYQIERELNRALDNGQLTLYFQPKVEITSGEVRSAEALIRWQHPDLGLVSPDDFVGVAEKSQQIIPIGRWVIETACLQAKHWQKAGHEICIAVNVSIVQFLYDDIYDVVTRALRETGLDPKLLQLEITESTLMQHPTKVCETCQGLRALGVRIAVDDFGVAYSSLNYLKQLPVDVLKIDKSFVDDCVTSHSDHMLVRTIIQLGHNLGKVVTAEGVNTVDQVDLLASEGCDEYQGYYYSRPLPPVEFIQRIQQGHHTAATPLPAH